MTKALRLVLMLLAVIGQASARAAPARHVPFVGCRSDGQQGPQAAPQTGGTPYVSTNSTTQLAYYQISDGTGVLAPRGWQCFGLYGSNGSTIIVRPGAIDWKRATSGQGLAGPAIQFSYSFGSTSGRFKVAEITARIFPAAKAFVESVEDEGIVDHPFARGPFPHDRIERRGNYRIFYTTPAGMRGLGTSSKLAVDALPIDGVVTVDPAGDMDMQYLAVRLPKSMRSLAREIGMQFMARR